MHLFLRFLHASHAAETRAVDCCFRGPEAEGLAGCHSPSLARSICLAFDEDGIFHLRCYSLGNHLAVVGNRVEVDWAVVRQLNGEALAVGALDPKRCIGEVVVGEGHG